MKPIYDIQGINPDNGYIIPCFGPDAEIDISKANASEENRIQICTSLAAISAGKQEASNPPARFKALLKEGAFNTASRPLEFIPVILKAKLSFHQDTRYYYLELKDQEVVKFTIEDFNNKICRFSKTHLIRSEMDIEEYIVCTNMRCLLNAGIDYDKIPYNENIENYYAFKLKVPMFVFNHMITHTQLSKVTKSDRVTNSTTKSLWLPDDIIKRCKEHKCNLTYKNSVKSYTDLLLDILHKDGDMEEITRLVQSTYPQETFRTLLKELGYKREIYQRAVIEFRYKEFVIAGWNDDYGFQNFIAERGGNPEWKNWVQDETKKVAILVNELISQMEK